MSGPKAQFMMEFLAAEGYRPELDSDGDVEFKAEGKTYFAMSAEDDATYFKILLPGLWSIENEDERLRVLAACDHATRIVKVAKMSTNDDNTDGAVELFLADITNVPELFARCMSALQTAVDLFVEHMNENAPN
jgi:hypothetical protein